MCGGTLDIKNNDTVGVCEYCGTKQTLPRLDNEKKANLYDRAAHFRQLNDYDKAMSLYEQVLAEDKTDAEAYWSIVLCRYGIEYVEDPATHKRIPTVNRTQYTSIFNDSDYKLALQYADPFQSEIYEQEAKSIDDIQKGILKISKNEKPFDIFICYKESDDNGRRTMDSVLAYDVYKELVGAGYKVFFSRITLEDKIGTAYEPYIFAALNSAPIMLVIGTKPEYFNAIWVKNEWSRFLGMIKSGAKKTLIPMYKDMNPYDLPKEFAHLQAQDMNNLGYMQDLLRGIRKLIAVNDKNANETEKEVLHKSDKKERIKNLMSRADIAMDNQQWKEADGYFEQILEIEPQQAYAYVGKLMAEMKLSELNDLKGIDFDIENNNNFKNALRFADDGLKGQLNSIKNTVNNIRYQKTQSRKKGIKIGVIIAATILVVCTVGFIIYRTVIAPKKAYEMACEMMNSGDMEGAIAYFESLGEYQESQAKLEECRKTLTLRNAAVGDIISYGNYNGNTEWIVLDKDDGKLLLLSKTYVGIGKYDDDLYCKNWESSYIRQWLNSVYIENAFDEIEKNRICRVKADRGDSVRDIRWATSSDESVDLVFLLSTYGAELYNSTYKDIEIDEWWLRTNKQGFHYCSAAYVDDYGGKIYHFGQTNSEKAIRPAIWIDVSDL